MKNAELAALRLSALGIANSSFETPLEVVKALGALQAQDFEGARWSIGLRLRDRSRAAQRIEQALADKQILRTWPMRGTLHFVPAEDARWMLKLMTPRVLAGMRRRHQQLGLDQDTLEQSGRLFRQALEGGKQLLRSEMLDVLETGGISTQSQRGYHLLGWHAQQGLICFGLQQGKQHSFVLLDEWVPRQLELSQQQAQAEIARRFFNSHGPATLQDLVRWTGLSVQEARSGLNAVKAELQSQSVEQQEYWFAQDISAPHKQEAYLLPGFDEYILGYKDRSAVLPPQYATRICPGNNGMFMPTIILNGQVKGTWKRELKKKELQICLFPFGKLSATELKALESVAQALGEFLDRPARLV